MCGSRAGYPSMGSTPQPAAAPCCIGYHLFICAPDAGAHGGPARTPAVSTAAAGCCVAAEQGAHVAGAQAEGGDTARHRALAGEQDGCVHVAGVTIGEQECRQLDVCHEECHGLRDMCFAICAMKSAVSPGCAKVDRQCVQAAVIREACKNSVE
eukprot:1159576-Pelagomonas_calceolata.AAC.2